MVLGALLPWGGFAQPSHESGPKPRDGDERLHVAPAGGIGATARGDAKLGARRLPSKGGPSSPSVIPKPRPETALVKPKPGAQETRLEHPKENEVGGRAGIMAAVHPASGREPGSDHKTALEAHGVGSHAQQPPRSLLPALGGPSSFHNKTTSGLNGTGMTHRL